MEQKLPQQDNDPKHNEKHPRVAKNDTLNYSEVAFYEP